MGPLIPLQVGNTALIVFVSYFGSRVHRPRLIGCGAILVTLAGILMTVPHFISEPYRYDRTSPGKNRRGWAEGGHELPHYCTQGPLPGFQWSRWVQLPRTPIVPHTPPHCLLQLQPGWVLLAALGSGDRGVVLGQKAEALWVSLGEGLLVWCCFFLFFFEVEVDLGPGLCGSSRNICGIIITVSHTTY